MRPAFSSAVPFGRAARSVLDGVFGASLASPDEAIAGAGWTRDAPDDYCRRCGDAVGVGELTPRGCATCRETGGFADRVVRLGPYAGPLQHWVRALKYPPHWKEMAWRLGAELADAILELDVIDGHPVWIVPMPTDRVRRFHRGIDHSAEIARAVAQRLHAPCRFLLRDAGGVPQVNRSPTERRRAGGKQITLREPFLPFRRPLNLDRNVVLVLVDDVRTTGATLRRARRRLEGLQPAMVVGAVLAVSDAAARRIRTS